MARKKKEPMTKRCERCNKIMTQPRWANGRLDSTFTDRRFCSTKCAGFRKTNKPNTMRKRARNLINRLQCQRCGGKLTLHVHHKDGNTCNNRHCNLIVLCAKCHNAEHAKLGTHRRLSQKKCPVCLQSFQPRRRKRYCVETRTV